MTLRFLVRLLMYFSFWYYLWTPSVGACARFSLSLFHFVHFVICFSDVLMSGIWNEVAVLEDPSLRSLVPDLLDLQMGSRASSTVTKYKSGWLRWRTLRLQKLASRLFLRSLCILRFLLRSLLTIVFEQYGCILCRSRCLWH